MCKVYTGYCGTSETEHGLVCASVRSMIPELLSLRTGAQTMLYLSLIVRNLNEALTNDIVSFEQPGHVTNGKVKAGCVLLLPFMSFLLLEIGRT